MYEIHSEAFRTPNGTPYLQKPGVVMIGMPVVNLERVRGFLDGFDPELGFQSYLEDNPFGLPPSERLCKFAGQLCYMSMGPQRTMNAEADKYLENIKSSGHGSVLEHANFSFLFYGTSRSMTHELVRHRAGFAYSQVSQRYVDGKALRFVERPEDAADPELHARFMARIDRAAKEYEEKAQRLLALQKEGSAIMGGEAKRDRRKKVNQSARSLLPNETEAPIVTTANVRAWRHFLEMRASEHAEVEIRELAFRAFLCLRHAAPILFNDYQEKELSDGTKALETKYRKV